MTNDEMRKAIAEHLGWSHVHVYSEDGQAPIVCGTPPSHPYLSKVPNWPEDLNAMAEVEEVIKASHLWVPYCNTLAMLCGGTHEDDGGLFVSHTDAIGAPASTRAEAALQILSQRRGE